MDIINAINNFLWGTPLLVAIIGTGILFSVLSGFFQFVHMGHILKNSIGVMFQKGGSDTEDAGGRLSPLEAVFSAIGGTVGTGSISGCATSIALGGPGALFWIWVAGALGMLIKLAETALAVHYRKTDEQGDPYGGPTYYMETGLGAKIGGLWKPLALIFGGGIFLAFFITAQNYNASEAIASTFNVPMIAVSAFYTIVTYAIILGGINSIGKILSILSPLKICIYVFGALGVILLDIGNIPATFSLIFRAAFNPQAALGGAAGFTVMNAMSRGFARMVYSTEAGWGTSPMVHATARTDHPLKQGFMGAIEVFIATFITMTLTGLMVINSGLWNSGEVGGTLALSVFESKYGMIGRSIMSVTIFLFAITVSTGWAVYYEVLLRHALGDNSKYKDLVLKVYRWVNPLPGFLMVVIAVVAGMPGDIVWALVDIASGIPTFVNVVVLFALSGTFIKLLKDYKARYMGIGTVDPNFHIFYEDGLKK